MGDLVLKKVSLVTHDPIEEKLRPNWEGHYLGTSCHRPGMYHLKTM